MPSPQPLSPPSNTAWTAVDALAGAFDDEGPYSPDTTKAGAMALVTCASYLGTCMDAAQPSAVPTMQDLAQLCLSLNAATVSLAKGLAGTVSTIDRRVLPGALVGADIIRVTAARAALSHAELALVRAARGLADAYEGAAGIR